MESCFCQIGSCVLCDARLNSNISSDQVCEILGMLNRIPYGAREIIFREGEPSTHLFIIREGQIKLTTSNANGRDQIIGLGTAGHVIGFDTVEDDIYTYTAETIAPVIACKIRHKDMLRVLEQNPSVAMRIVEILNEELSQAKNLIRVLGHNGSVERVATFILSLIPRRGTVPQEILFPLSREEMAEMIGLRIESVSRVMADLQRKKVIEAPRGYIRILDVKQLHALSGIFIPHDELKNKAALASVRV